MVRLEFSSDPGSSDAVPVIEPQADKTIMETINDKANANLIIYSFYISPCLII